MNYFRRLSPILILIFFLFTPQAFASLQILDPDIYQSEIEYLGVHSGKVFDTDLRTTSQDKFNRLVRTSPDEDLDHSFFSALTKNTYEDENVVVNLQWKNFFTYSNSQPVHLLELNAQTNPFLATTNNLYRLDGAFGGTAAQLYLETFRFFSFDIKPYFIFQDTPNLRHVYIKEAFGSIHVNKLSIDIGKARTHWGYGAYQPMTFGDDFEPFFMIRARNNDDIQFDGLLSFLGKIQFEVFHGWLDADRKFPHTRIIGTTFSFQPIDRLSFHITQTVLYGGVGAPTNDPSVFFSESFVTASNPSNRNDSLGIRYRIPKLEIEPYLDVYVEDCCGTPPINPRDDQELVGIYIPPRSWAKKLDMSVEWVRTNSITYRHEKFQYIQSQKVMGHPIGPDADGIYAVVRYFHSPQLQFDNMFAYEIRGVAGRAASNQGDIDIATVEPSYQNAEKRYRFEEYISYFPDPKLKITLHTGFERVDDAMYTTNNDRWQALIGLETSYNF